MFAPANIYHFLNDPINYLEELKKKHGDPFPLSFPRSPTVWLTARPELTKTIFSAPVDSFMVSEYNPVSPLLGTEGLLMLSGSKHLSERKEFTPKFSKKNLHPFAHTIQKVFLDILKSQPPEGKLNLQEYSLKCTLQIILKFIFPRLSPSEFCEAEELTQNFLKSYSPSFLFLPKWVPGTWAPFERKKTILDERFYHFFCHGQALEGPLADMLEKAEKNKEEVLDHIRTFIVAGHETSATSLVWALYYIHHHPHIKNRLVEELSLFSESSDEQFLEDLLSNNYLDALVSETLRIQPPVPFITRKIINRDFKLGDKDLKINDELGVCISLLHREEGLWAKPFEFSPERFMDRKYSPYEYAPFGGGTRKCIGAELAILELKILIAHFIKHYQATIAYGDESLPPLSEVLQITIGPKKPIHLSYFKSVQSP